LRTGISVVLGGPPNSGKSTLLNALAERDMAIVSPVAGTTRDRIDVPVSRNGVAYLLTDTAGLADTTDDPVEAIGIDRARRAMETADILVWLGDDPPPVKALWVHTRMDLPGREAMPAGPSIGISVARDQGVTQLWGEIAAVAATLLPRESEVVLNERQRGLLKSSRTILAAGDMTDALLIAETLRSALVPLHRITGSSDTEAMLDGLFGAFCLGK
jgi:tRNA modification GTPase